MIYQTSYECCPENASKMILLNGQKIHYLPSYNVKKSSVGTMRAFFLPPYSSHELFHRRELARKLKLLIFILFCLRIV